MQKIFILLLCLLSTITNAQERGISLQNNKTETPIVTGNTYAVIVGISNYKYIKPLSFADEDAKLFKEFLQSKAGGNVKEENILLLINDDAKASTHPRIRHWINDLKKPQKGDRVYFYFAGHGDAIDGDEYFFLLQDCDPAGDKNNYIGGMASVLQMYNIKSFIKNTLTDKGVQVVMIWDACRTNELPGGAEGMKNAQQGIAEKNNGEIMMLSASAGETALENNIYAHGHGLFTYYLIDALSGAADNIDVGGNGDGKVDMGELDTWVKMKVRNDAKNKFKSEQHPKFIYNTDVIISTLDEKFKQSWALQKQDNNNYVYNAPKTPRTASAIMDTMVTNLYNQCMYLIKLDSIEGNNGAEAMLTKMQQQYPTNNLTQEAEFNLAMEYINLAQDKINLYLSGLDITASTTVENNFKQKIQKTKGQTYYQSGNFITKAIDLLTATGNYDTTFIQQLIAKKNFFLGRSFYGNEGKVKLRKDAINYARIALQIQPNAAYTNHLLGLLYEQSNNLDSALYYERRAISLAPKWFNCTSLLGDIFRGKKIYDSALYYLKEALKLNTMWHL
ncbi:MAG: caspase family protein [Bacteroidetes bacterium]|nr:caspase family protein [Bacteroidota bacterium]